MHSVPRALTPAHALLALLVMIVWGANFVVIKAGLETFPPLLLAALRFTCVVFPAVFLLKRPAVPFRDLVNYGLLVGIGQFGLLFIAMKADISPAIASLVAQTQVLFTIALAVALGRDRVHLYQVVALLITIAGIGLILFHTDGSTTVRGLMLTLAAAFAWAITNLIVRRTPPSDMLAFVVWASIFSFVPLYALSFALEGWPAMREGLLNAGAGAWGSVLWQAVANTLFGYVAWSFLLAHYPAPVIAPMSLLVPIVGMFSSWVWIGEPMQDWKIEAAALVLLGLALNMLWPKFRRSRLARDAMRIPPSD